MTGKSRSLVVVTAVLVAAVDATPHAQGAYDGAVGAMDTFLQAWVLDGNMQEAMAYFSTSDTALALTPKHILSQRRPGTEHKGFTREVAVGYWTVMNALWRTDRRVDVDLGDVVALDGELLKFLHKELDVDLIYADQPFLVFVADERVMDNFNAGAGDIAAVLQPEKNTVLAMIADFKDRPSPYVGPFVSFWVEEPAAIWVDSPAASDESKWRIYALGSFPP